MPERRKQRLSGEKIIIINRNMFNNSKSIPKVIAYMKKREFFPLSRLKLEKAKNILNKLSKIAQQQ